MTTPTATHAGASGAQCLYVFGVIDAGDVGNAAPDAAGTGSTGSIVDRLGEDLAAVDPAAGVLPPLRAAVAGHVAAVYADADADVLTALTERADVADEPADDPAGGLGPLASLATCHDAVVRRLAGAGPVLPMRLGTLSTDLDALTAMLRRKQDTLAARLDAVRGRTEWTLRVQPPTADAPRPAAPSGQHGSAASGAAYLRDRAARRRDEAARRDALATAVAVADGRLAADAERITGTDPLGPTVSRSYLVPDTARPRFRHAADGVVADLRALGCAVEITGPLPPYSFADLRLEVRA